MALRRSTRDYNPRPDASDKDLKFQSLAKKLDELTGLKTSSGAYNYDYGINNEFIIVPIEPRLEFINEFNSMIKYLGYDFTHLDFPSKINMVTNDKDKHRLEIIYEQSRKFIDPFTVAVYKYDEFVENNDIGGTDIMDFKIYVDKLLELFLRACLEYMAKYISTEYFDYYRDIYNKLIVFYDEANEKSRNNKNFEDIFESITYIIENNIHINI